MAQGTARSDEGEYMNLSPEIAKPAKWVQEQMERESYADVGFIITIHDGEIRKTDYSITVKSKAPTKAGGPHDTPGR